MGLSVHVRTAEPEILNDAKSLIFPCSGSYMYIAASKTIATFANVRFVVRFSRPNTALSAASGLGKASTRGEVDLFGRA